MSNLAEEFGKKINASKGVVDAEVVRQEPATIKVMEVEVPVGDPEVTAERHRDSISKYPEVKIDSDEYIVMGLERHSIGLAGIILTSLILFVVLVSAWILICFTPNRFEISEQVKNNLSLIFAPLSVLTLVMGYIGYSTYTSNKFFITNERVIQYIVRGLLDRKTQIINLESAEDISFVQTGIIQHIFNYGTVRMSTVGDESTYTFHLAKNPAKIAEILGEVAECARENQPIPESIMEQARKISSR